MKLIKTAAYAGVLAIAGLFATTRPGLLHAQSAPQPAAAPAPTAQVASAQTTGTLSNSLTGDPATLELRATQAFNRGEWSLAKAMLQKVAERYGNDQEKLGPVLEKIRVCQKNIDDAAKNPQAVAQLNAQQGPNPATEAGTRVPHPAPKAGETVDLAIKELGNFEYDAEKGGGIPSDVMALSGAHIRTRGFMIPLDQAENITEFALVPSLFSCCLGQPPQIQHTIVVRTPKGKAVNYFPDEIQVEGTLTVKERKDDNYIVSIFEMEASSIRPAPIQK